MSGDKKVSRSPEWIAARSACTKDPDVSSKCGEIKAATDKLAAKKACKLAIRGCMTKKGQAGDAAGKPAAGEGTGKETGETETKPETKPDETKDE